MIHVKFSIFFYSISIYSLHQSSVVPSLWLPKSHFNTPAKYLPAPRGYNFFNLHPVLKGSGVIYFRLNILQEEKLQFSMQTISSLVRQLWLHSASTDVLPDFLRVVFNLILRCLDSIPTRTRLLILLFFCVFISFYAKRNIF